MNKGTTKIALLFVCIVFLSGCSVHQHMVPKQVVAPKGEIPLAYDLLLEPTEALGIEVTPNLMNAKITVFWGIFNEILLGESAFNRVRWVGWAVDKLGQEYFVQVIRWPIGQLDINGNHRIMIVIDGVISPQVARNLNLRVLYFSSALHWGYNAFGEEFELNQEKFLEGSNFRHRMIQKNGTSVSELRPVPIQEFYAIFKGWHQFSTPDGSDILTPLSKEDVKKIAGKNPAYSAFQKWIEYARKPVMPFNPIGTGIANGLEVLQANFGDTPNKGWDLHSIITRREAGQQLKELSERYRKLLRFWQRKALKQ